MNWAEQLTDPNTRILFCRAHASIACNLCSGCDWVATTKRAIYETLVKLGYNTRRGVKKGEPARWVSIYDPQGLVIALNYFWGIKSFDPSTPRERIVDSKSRNS